MLKMLEKKTGRLMGIFWEPGERREDVAIEGSIEDAEAFKASGKWVFIKTVEEGV